MGQPLSEADSKTLLAPYGLPLLREEFVATPATAGEAAARVGFPAVVKLCGERIAHKTERGLVRLGLRDAAAVEAAGRELLAAAGPDDGEVGLLVAPMVTGARELIAGMSRDVQFGPTVMIGVGGILTEALDDASVRLVPLSRTDALEMIDDLRARALLGPLRGEPAVDRDALAGILLALAAVAEEHPEVDSIDLNPLIIVAGEPVAVDALVVLGDDR